MGWYFGVIFLHTNISVLIERQQTIQILLLKAIKEAISYLQNHISYKSNIAGIQREETPEIPLLAIREIVVNAFAHANYRSITEHEIDITPTIIDIYNPGEFPINYKPEDFAERRIQSMPRNRKILDVLYRSKNVEVQGSGIRKVLELCAANNVKYEYYNNEFGFRFSFHRNSVTINVTINVTKNVTSDITTESPKRVNKLDF